MYDNKNILKKRFCYRKQKRQTNIDKTEYPITDCLTVHLEMEKQLELTSN